MLDGRVDVAVLHNINADPVRINDDKVTITPRLIAQFCYYRHPQ